MYTNTLIAVGMSIFSAASAFAQAPSSDPTPDATVLAQAGEAAIAPKADGEVESRSHGSYLPSSRSNSATVSRNAVKIELARAMLRGEALQVDDNNDSSLPKHYVSPARQAELGQLIRRLEGASPGEQ